MGPMKPVKPMEPMNYGFLEPKVSPIIPDGQNMASSDRSSEDVILATFSVNIKVGRTCIRTGVLDPCMERGKMGSFNLSSFLSVHRKRHVGIRFMIFDRRYDVRTF